MVDEKGHDNAEEIKSFEKLHKLYDIPLEYTMKKEFSIFGEFVQTRIQHPKRHPVETIKNN